MRIIDNDPGLDIDQDEVLTEAYDCWDETPVDGLSVTAWGNDDLPVEDPPVVTWDDDNGTQTFLLPAQFRASTWAIPSDANPLPARIHWRDPNDRPWADSDGWLIAMSAVAGAVSFGGMAFFVSIVSG